MGTQVLAIAFWATASPRALQWACLSLNTEFHLLPTVSMAFSSDLWVSLLMLSSMLLLAIFSYSSNTVERGLLSGDTQISARCPWHLRSETAHEHSTPDLHLAVGERVSGSLALSQLHDRTRLHMGYSFSMTGRPCGQSTLKWSQHASLLVPLIRCMALRVQRMVMNFISPVPRIFSPAAYRSWHWDTHNKPAKESKGVGVRPVQPRLPARLHPLLDYL